MKAEQKIIKALENKGYFGIKVEFEPVSYYSTGREGGYDIEVESEFEDFPSWENVELPEGLVCDILDGYIMCYNVKDALTIIDLLPIYNKP